MKKKNDLDWNKIIQTILSILAIICNLFLIYNSIGKEFVSSQSYIFQGIACIIWIVYCIVLINIGE